MTKNTTGNISINTSPNAFEQAIHSKLIMDMAENTAKYLHEDQRAYLLGPLAHRRFSYDEQTPFWMYKVIIPERLHIIHQEVENGTAGWQVGPTELMVALSTLLLEAPCSYKHIQVFIWATTHASYALEDSKSILQSAIKKPIISVTDEEITHPDGVYYKEYKELCSGIRQSIVAMYKRA